MKIRGREVNVDVAYELKQFHWKGAKWTDDGMKLICCSPFRPDDSHPSFFVRLKKDGQYTEGLWVDSGGIDNEWQKGGFVKLYAFLHDIDIESAEDILLEQYHSERAEVVWRPPSLSFKKKKRLLPEDSLSPFKDDNIYLKARNIRSDIIEKFEVGYSREKNVIAIPWRTASGELANIKYRKASKKEKLFWYDSGTPIKELVWGLQEIYRSRIDTCILCESEIDALQSWSYGIPAIAIGGSAFDEKRAEMVIKSPLKHIIICTDNDKVGNRLRQSISARLANNVKVSHLYIPYPYKDINDIRSESLFHKIYESSLRSSKRKFSIK